MHQKGVDSAELGPKRVRRPPIRALARHRRGRFEPGLKPPSSVSRQRSNRGAAHPFGTQFRRIDPLLVHRSGRRRRTLSWRLSHGPRLMISDSLSFSPNHGDTVSRQRRLFVDDPLTLGSSPRAFAPARAGRPRFATGNGSYGRLASGGEPPITTVTCREARPPGPSGRKRSRRGSQSKGVVDEEASLP